MGRFRDLVEGKKAENEVFPVREEKEITPPPAPETEVIKEEIFEETVDTSEVSKPEAFDM